MVLKQVNHFNIVFLIRMLIVMPLPNLPIDFLKYCRIIISLFCRLVWEMHYMLPVIMIEPNSIMTLYMICFPTKSGELVIQKKILLSMPTLFPCRVILICTHILKHHCYALAMHQTIWRPEKTPSMITIRRTGSGHMSSFQGFC